MKRCKRGTPLLERITSKVSVDAETGCWNWQGMIDEEGYGRIKVAGRCALAHRESYTAHGGQLSSDLLIRHRCHNTECVNPAHLLPGTDQDNADDDARDRPSKNRKLHPDSRPVLIAMLRAGRTFAETGAVFGLTRHGAHTCWKRHATSADIKAREESCRFREVERRTA